MSCGAAAAARASRPCASVAGEPWRWRSKRSNRRALRRASSTISRASSIEMHSGGRIFRTFPWRPVVPISTPRSAILSFTRVRHAPAGSRVARSRTSSTPVIRPRPRTSPIGFLALGQLAEPRAQVLADRRGVGDQLLRPRCTSSTASAAAHATGFPPNVLKNVVCAPNRSAIVATRVRPRPPGSRSPSACRWSRCRGRPPTPEAPHARRTGHGRPAPRRRRTAPPASCAPAPRARADTRAAGTKMPSLVKAESTKIAAGR